MNADGHLDLAVGNSGANTMTVLMGHGDGTFDPGVDYPTDRTPTSLAVGDVNGDGKLDVVAAVFDEGGIDIFLGAGDGTFALPTLRHGGFGPTSVQVADLNGDGAPEIITVDQRANTFTIFRNAGAGAFLLTSTVNTSGTPTGSALGDFDGDGHIDLIITNRSTATFSLYRGNATGTFSTKREFPVGSTPVDVATGDYDGDCLTDVAVVNAFANTVSVLLGTGTAFFRVSGRQDFAVGDLPLAIAGADLNGDGRPDLLVANSGENTASVLVNTGGQSYLDAPPAPRRLPTALVLMPARPNPSRGPCELRFVLPAQRPVSVAIYDVSGRLVRDLRSGGVMPAGENVVAWDGREAGGARARDGVYLMQVRAGGESRVAKLLLVR